MKPGRKSTTEKSLAVVDLTGARIECPDDFTPAERDSWREIVDSLPADWFRPSDKHLLKCYVKSYTFYNMAAEMMMVEGIVVDVDGKQRAHPAKDILTSQASAMAQMAVKLRLCPSGRVTAAKAATGGSKPAAARPWDKTGTDAEE